MKALLINSLDPKVHILRRYIRYDLVPYEPAPDAVETDHLLHFGNSPVLTPGVDTLGHMRYAYENGNKEFWHRREGQKTVLIGAGNIDWVREATDAEQRDITERMTKYRGATINYGHPLASLLYGRQIPLDAESRSSRLRADREQMYGTLTPAATRTQMIDALQRHGRFRFLDESRSSTRSFMVELANWNADPRQNPVMDIQVKPSSKSLLGKLRDLHL